MSRSETSGGTSAGGGGAGRLRVVEFQETPNPSAMKVVLDRAAPGAEGVGMRSYRKGPGGAGADPGMDAFGARVMNVPGVQGVLIVRDWVTVTKEPEASWSAVKAAVRRVIESEA